jgi:hypothetical protein
MTATVKATAAANGYPQRPATAHNARTIRTNLGYVRPEKQTVGSSPGGPRTLEGRNPQFRNPICARICARDAAGQTEIGETRKTRNNLVAHACRGQRDDERLFETQETRVVWLITQRSGFKSRPRYQVGRSEASSDHGRGLLHAPCDGIVHEASEEGRRGGWAVRRTRGRRSRRRRCTTSTQVPRPFICDKLQIKCNSPTMGP